MFQFALAFEAQFRKRAVTLSVGWGLAMFENMPWWRQLVAIIYQGAPGIRRYGLVLLGFFITAQGVDIEGARKSMVGAVIQQGGRLSPKNTRAGAFKNSSVGGPVRNP